MRLSVITAMALAALPASAQDLRPAPDYYIDALFSLTMAEALAQSCSTMGMDLLAAGAATTELQEKLIADGFDAEEPFAQMIDPAPVLRDLQTAFLIKHPDLNTPDEAKVCAAAQVELEEATTIGRFLNAGVVGGTEPVEADNE